MIFAILFSTRVKFFLHQKIIVFFHGSYVFRPSVMMSERPYEVTSASSLSSSWRNPPPPTTTTTTPHQLTPWHYTVT